MKVTLENIFYINLYSCLASLSSTLFFSNLNQRYVVKWKRTMNTLKSPIMRDRHASFERSALNRTIPVRFSLTRLNWREPKGSLVALRFCQDIWIS